MTRGQLRGVAAKDKSFVREQNRKAALGSCDEVPPPLRRQDADLTQLEVTSGSHATAQQEKTRAMDSTEFDPADYELNTDVMNYADSNYVRRLPGMIDQGYSEIGLATARRANQPMASTANRPGRTSTNVAQYQGRIVVTPDVSAIPHARPEPYAVYNSTVIQQGDVQKEVAKRPHAKACMVDPSKPRDSERTDQTTQKRSAGVNFKEDVPNGAKGGRRNPVVDDHNTVQEGMAVDDMAGRNTKVLSIGKMPASKQTVPQILLSDDSMGRDSTSRPDSSEPLPTDLDSTKIASGAEGFAIYEDSTQYETTVHDGIRPAFASYPFFATICDPNGLI